MANNTTVEATTVEATTVETADADNNQARRDLHEVGQSILDAGALGNNALDFLADVFAASTNEARHELITKADRATIQMAGSIAYCMYQLKVDANGSIAKALPDLTKEIYLSQVEKVDRTVILEVARSLSKLSIRSSDEELASYGDAGCFYAGTPLGVDFGLEVGIRTGEGADTQRSGLVVGLRLDHLTGAKPAARLGLPKAKC